MYVRFTEEEIKHFLAPREEVIYSYVVEKEKKITDFVSFYNLPSSVLNNPKHSHIKVMHYIILVGCLLVLSCSHFDAFETAGERRDDHGQEGRLRCVQCSRHHGKQTVHQ